MANETRAPISTPTTLDAWVAHLDAVDLPIPQTSHARVFKTLNDSRRSLREIAEVMQDSPALALRLIREANQQAQSSLSEPAESLEVAINRLGLKRTQMLLEHVPALAIEDIPLAYRQIQLISQHAAQQAIGLFGNRLARLWQEIYWSSLLFLSPLWALALTHPLLLETWERRVVGHNECASKVERQLFGVPLFDICRSLAELWRLPGWVMQGYTVITEERRTLVRVLHIARDTHHPLRQQQLLDADPALRRWLNQPANSVLLANCLALSAQQGWDTPHNLRWQYVTSLLPANAPGRSSAAGTPAGREQRALSLQPRPLASGPGIALAVGLTPQRGQFAGSPASLGRGTRRLAQTLRAAAGATQRIQQPDASEHLCPRSLAGVRHAPGDDTHPRQDLDQPERQPDCRPGQNRLRPDRQHQ